MRILHCMRAPVGGLFRHVLDLAAEQSALGHDVGILADANACDALTTRRFAAVVPHLNLGLKLVPMGRKPGLADVSAIKAVASHASGLSLDVLHGHGAKGGAYARLAGRILPAKGGVKVKTFYTPHGGTLNFPAASTEGRIYLQLERVLAGMTSGLIFESDFARRMFAERVGSLGRPERVVPNGLQPADFEPAVAASDAADLLFVGELRDIKGVDVLLKALRELNNSARITAVIVGDGPHAGTFHALARDLDLVSCVRFAGALPAREAFSLGKILVVPSLKESFPYIVLEGAAAGLPMVATNVGGIPEIVAGTDMTLVPAGDVAALAAAIGASVQNRDTARQRAQTLKDAVQRQFTVARMTRDILNFYASTAGH